MAAGGRTWTARERRLAIVTGGIAVLAVAYAAVLGALDWLAVLDAQIEVQEDALVDAAERAGQRPAVEATFRKIAQEHASGLSAEEIYDGLSREITRLTFRNLPPPGGPLPQTQAERLVVINSIPAGVLDDTGDGYRTYRLNFRVEESNIRDILTFLERIRESPQALRIDALTLSRAWNAQAVAAQVEIVRTVVDGPSSTEPDEPPAAVASSPLQNGGFEDWDASGSRFPGWTADGVVVNRAADWATEGHAALHAAARDGGGAVYQELTLETGRAYRMAMDAYAAGPVRVGVVDPADGTALDGTVALPEAPVMQRYMIDIDVPGPPGGQRVYRVPHMALDAGSTLSVDRVELRPKGE